MITPESRAKVLDFGLAKRLPDSTAAEVTSSRLAVGHWPASSSTPFVARRSRHSTGWPAPCATATSGPSGSSETRCSPASEVNHVSIKSWHPSTFAASNGRNVMMDNPTPESEAVAPRRRCVPRRAVEGGVNGKRVAPCPAHLRMPSVCHRLCRLRLRCNNSAACASSTSSSVQTTSRSDRHGPWLPRGVTSTTSIS
jgi:hypothetical protein